MTGQYLIKWFCKVLNWIVSIPYYLHRTYCRYRLKGRRFTIISNNCWAGKLYQYLDMPYLSPTVGLYFFADDYLKFVKNLHYYLSLELKFISLQESKYCEELKKRKQENIPIGILDDVEIVFLHYKTQQEAKEKWDRRKARINWDDVFIKFSRMNGCTDEHLKEFDEIPFPNKFMLNISKHPIYSSEVYWDGPQNESEIILDTTPFPGNLSLCRLLTLPQVGYINNGEDCEPN